MGSSDTASEGLRLALSTDSKSRVWSAASIVLAVPGLKPAPIRPSRQEEDPPTVGTGIWAFSTTSEVDPHKLPPVTEKAREKLDDRWPDV